MSNRDPNQVSESDIDIPVDTKKKSLNDMSLMEVVIQDSINSKEEVSVYLVNGIKLAGFAVAQDETTVLLANSSPSNKPFAVNRTSIASFVPRGSEIRRPANFGGTRPPTPRA